MPAATPDWRARPRAAISVVTSTRESRPWTKVVVNQCRFHLVRGQPQTPLVMVTTELTVRLTAGQFDPIMASRVNRVSKARGRIVFAVVEEEVVAAVSYHVQDSPRAPIEVTALAPRIDQARALGDACILPLLDCLHEVAALWSPRPRPRHLRYWESGQHAVTT